jgi:hypothetical protein
MGGISALGVVHITRFVALGHKAPFSLPQSAAFAAGTIIHADVLLLLPVGGLEDDRRRLGAAFLAFFYSLIIPEMAPCNVSVDSPMAACITYEPPGSFLKFICDEGVSAISL